MEERNEAYIIQVRPYHLAYLCTREFSLESSVKTIFEFFISYAHEPSYKQMRAFTLLISRANKRF